MKGLVLAASFQPDRLYPVTEYTAVELLPVYDKPLLYYPITTLMLAGIREIGIAGPKGRVATLRRLLGDGRAWGIHLMYLPMIERRPEAMLLAARDWLAGDSLAVIHSDQIFYGRDLVDLLQMFAARPAGAGVFAVSTREPGERLMIELDEEDHPLRLESTSSPRSGEYLIPGLYFFDDQLALKLAGLPSRGAAGLAGILRQYLQENTLKAVILGRGIAWLDIATPEALAQTSSFIQVIQERQGFMIACPEEIAYRNGWIDRLQLARLARRAGQTAYGLALSRLLDEGI